MVVFLVVLGVVWVVLGVVFLAPVPAVALPLLLPVRKPPPNKIGVWYLFRFVLFSVVLGVVWEVLTFSVQER